MPFDPDAYLKKNAAPAAPQPGGFNPDAYLAKHDRGSAQYNDEDNPVRRTLIGAGNIGLGALNAVGRAVDRFTGAPTRSAISAAQNAQTPGAIIPDAASAAWGQFGADPDKAPTGEQIVKQAGAPDGVASKVLGFGMDMAANPLNALALGPVQNGLAAAGDLAAPLARAGVAKTSELMTGVPSEAIERLIQRPTQVMGAEREGNALNVARNARDELLTRDKAEDTAISGARQKFKDQFGDQKVDTSPIIQGHGEFMQKNAPTSQGVGPLSSDEIEGLNGIARKGLTTENAIPRPGVPSAIPERSAADLQKLGDDLSSQVTKFDQSKLPGSGDTRYQAYLRSLYRQVKERLHQLDPEGLTKADAQFSDYADKAGRLGRLENEDQMEGFINNYYGKNKTLMRESAQDIIPNSVEDIADIGASRAFTKQGPAGSEMGARRIVGSSIGGVLGAHGAVTHNPYEMLAGAVAHTATSPGVHKAVIGNTSKLIDSPLLRQFAENPALIESVESPELRATLTKALGLGGKPGIPAPAYADTGASRDVAAEPDQSQYTHPDTAKQQFLEGH